MSVSKKSVFGDGMNQPNITPLADVTTTLIVVFLITMPSIMWNGIQVKPAEASADQQVIQTSQVKDRDQILTIEVLPEGLTLNGVAVRSDQLEPLLTSQLRTREDKTVVVVPSDLVELGTVVDVLDIAKASGATALALLNELGR